MMKTNSRGWIRGWVLGASFLLPVALIAIGGRTASAEQHGPILRSVDGQVVNRSDAPLNGAVVYLKDSKSLAVKSYITDAEGKFRFTQLSQNTDYELWADSNGTRSKSKSISSFDNKSSFNFKLTVDTEK